MNGRIIRPEPLRAALLEGRVKPLSVPLAAFLVNRCLEPGMRRIEACIVDNAPSSLVELCNAWPGEGTPVPVSGEHAGDTIWGRGPLGRDLNALFRAWHDTLHVLCAADFSLSGERTVAIWHLNMLGRFDPILWAETYGQAEYEATYGVFPRRQRAFVVHAFRHGLTSALAAGATGVFA